MKRVNENKALRELKGTSEIGSDNRWTRPLAWLQLILTQVRGAQKSRGQFVLRNMFGYPAMCLTIAWLLPSTLLICQRLKTAQTKSNWTSWNTSASRWLSFVSGLKISQIDFFGVCDPFLRCLKYIYISCPVIGKVKGIFNCKINTLWF